jgi:ubiquinone biosynthesis protein UbiJ
LKNSARFIQRGVERRQRDLAEIITEEWKLAPQALEIAYFADQVDDLKSDFSRLEARFNQLLERHPS